VKPTPPAFWDAAAYLCEAEACRQDSATARPIIRAPEKTTWVIIRCAWRCVKWSIENTVACEDLPLCGGSSRSDQSERFGGLARSKSGQI
jgi:hypothetical protein